MGSVSLGASYDAIGANYSSARREDPRVARAIWDALGEGRRILNVGAGTGNYEPRDRFVVAVEPSLAMIEQRRPDAAPCVRAVVEDLPLADGSFDVAMGVLTAHHWADRDRGIGELCRVVPRQVLLYFEPAMVHTLWFMDYWSQISALPTETDPPGEAWFRSVLDVREVRRVPVPHDCVDGFGAAYWSRPEAYLDPAVRAGISALAQLSPESVDVGHERLAADLASGAWDERHGHLRSLSDYDAGYRLIIAGA